MVYFFVPSIQPITNILVEFPDINAHWLITGRGEMFADQSVVLAADQEKDQLKDEYSKCDTTTKNEDE